MTSHGAKNGNSKKKNSQKISSSSEEDSEDLTVVGTSLAVGVNSVRQLIRAVLEGTKDELLYNECSLVFECKNCKNLFRSVANFISHKRRYCKKTYTYFNHDFYSDQLQATAPTPATCTLNGPSTSLSKQNGDVENGVKNHAARALSSRSTSEDSTINCGLEEIPLTVVAKYQTVLPANGAPPSMQQELRDLAEFSAPKEVVLSKDGHAIPISNKQVHKCSSCGGSFGTLLALHYHRNHAHQSEGCYGCPICKFQASTPWVVFRHLSKIHEKSAEQVRKLRHTVLTKPVKRQAHQPPPATSEARVPHDERIEEEKWLVEFSGKLRCYICGKQFSRNAALSVHLVGCKSESKAKQAELEPVLDCFQTCEKCGKQFSRKAVLRVHQQSCKSENDVQSKTCKQCNKVFTNARKLELHNSRCSPAPPKSPIPADYEKSSQLIIVERNPAHPSDIQVRRDYKIPAVVAPSLKLPGEPLAGSLETMIKRIQMGLDCGTFSIMSVQKKQLAITNGPAYNADDTVLKRLCQNPMPKAGCATPREFYQEPKKSQLCLTYGNARGNNSSSAMKWPTFNLDTNDKDFVGFDPISHADKFQFNRVQGSVRKMDVHLGKIAGSNGIVLGKFTPFSETRNVYRKAPFS